MKISSIIHVYTALQCEVRLNKVLQPIRNVNYFISPPLLCRMVFYHMCSSLEIVLFQFIFQPSNLPVYTCILHNIIISGSLVILLLLWLLSTSFPSGVSLFFLFFSILVYFAKTAMHLISFWTFIVSSAPVSHAHTHNGIPAVTYICMTAYKRTYRVTLKIIGIFPNSSWKCSSELQNVRELNSPSPQIFVVGPSYFFFFVRSINFYRIHLFAFIYLMVGAKIVNVIQLFRWRFFLSYTFMILCTWYKFMIV